MAAAKAAIKLAETGAKDAIKGIEIAFKDLKKDGETIILDIYLTHLMFLGLVVCLTNKLLRYLDFK